MKFLLGTKQHMIQFFTEDGVATAATVIQSGPLVVTQVKTPETDGYSAIQIGYGEQKPTRIGKALTGHFGAKGNFRIVSEFRTDDITVALGDTLVPHKVLNPGDKVIISGTSKGKGFQGVVKRHGFHGGRRSHGQKHSEREPGSIGSTGPQRVFKGTRMGGRMGGDRITVKNLEVLSIDPTTNTIIVKGAVPGRTGTLLEIEAK